MYWVGFVGIHGVKGLIRPPCVLIHSGISAPLFSSLMTWNDLHKIILTLMDSGFRPSQCEEEMNPYLIYINACSSTGTSPLHLATLSRCATVVRTLLKHGAKLYPNDSNETPLHWACQNGNISIIRCILRRMTMEEILITDLRGFTAADWAKQNGNKAAAFLVDSFIRSQQARRYSE